MTADVVVAVRETRAVDLFELLTSVRIHAVPVVDEEDHVLGVAARRDLVTAPPAPGTKAGRRHGPAYRIRRQPVGAVMTSPAVTVGPEATVAGAVRRMTTHRVGRLPVVDDAGRLTGIVTAGDLARLAGRPDEQIVAGVDEVLRRFLPSVHAAARILVTGGVVTLDGGVPAASTIPLAVHLARQVTGVVDVVDRLHAPEIRHDGEHLVRG